MVIVLILAFSKKKGNTIEKDISNFIKSAWTVVSSSSALWVLVPLAAFGFGWYMYLGQLLPPMAYDAWDYHLSWAALAHQERHLGPFDFPWPYLNYFPKNNDMLFLWSILGSGSERWANIVQGYFGLAAVLSCYVLGRRIGANRNDALACALLILSVPVVLHMQWKAMVDLAVFGGTLVSLTFVAQKRLTFMSCVLSGIMAGFVAGTKGSAIYMVVAVAFLLIYRLLPLGMHGLKFVKGGKKIRFAIGALSIWILFTFAFGSYYYIRNWVTTGNPTGYYNVDFAGYRFFEGTEDVDVHFNRGLLTPKLYDALEKGPEWPIVLDGFYDPNLFFSQGSRIGGWGPVWTILMLPAVPIGILWALIRRRWDVLALIITCLLPFFLFKYNHTWTRYHLIIIGAGVISFVYIISLLRETKFRSILLGLAAICMLLSIFISGPQDIVTPAGIKAARTATYQERDRFIFFNSFGSPEFTAALLSAQEPGTTIALAHRLPSNKTLAAWNPYYTNRVVWLPWIQPGATWHEKLLEEKVDFIYIAPGTGTERFALSHPELFTPVYTDTTRGSLLKVIKLTDGGDNNGR